MSDERISPKHTPLTRPEEPHENSKKATPPWGCHTKSFNFGSIMSKLVKPNTVAGPNASRLLPAKAAAEMISVSKRTWYRLNASGKIPAPLHIGSLVRWNINELTAWIDAGCPNRQTFNHLYGGQPNVN